jgi:hypothetical protein
LTFTPEFAGRLYAECASYMAGDMYKKVIAGKGQLGELSNK